MLTWLNQSTTGEHFAILRDYKPRSNVRCSLLKIGGLSLKYTKLGSGRPQANHWGCVCDLDKPLAYIYVRKWDYKLRIN